MALSCLNARAVRGTGLRTRSLARCIVRAQAGSSNTKVNFKIHRHVEFGQSLLLVGNIPELGSWDAKQAMALNWAEGDNWSTSATLPVGASLEYKYIIKRKDAFDWCPGQNKVVALPPAGSVEVTDTWENPHGSVVTLAPLEVAPDQDSTSSTTSETLVETSPLIEANEVLSDVLLTTNSALPEVASAVSTVENLQVPELENGIPIPAVLAAQHQQPPGLLANNIVQGVPLGAVAVNTDPITQYEEADKYQVVEVNGADKNGSMDVRAALSSTTVAAKSLDKMTMAELRSEVKRRGMSPLGNRRDLLMRLQKAGVL